MLESTSRPANIEPDATTANPAEDARHPAAATSGASELSNLKITLRSALRQYPDFPSPGVLFEDILPIFSDPSAHAALLRALDLLIASKFTSTDRPDVIVGLESRGFLFGPSLALKLGVAFVPVRKKGKLPGLTLTESFRKEYGVDFFQIQQGAIKPGQRVLIVDDIIATGGSAAAAGSLVTQSSGIVAGYVFMLELDFLKGREKLEAPVFTLLSSQEEALGSQ
ncbi:MAG: adenine phosphoribosyltransferase [Sarcosagium campestre]|nr:MAG: adenine phosphoribosyltransferase [Sarcosagium campestre]